MPIKGSAHNGYTLDGDRLDCHIPRPLNIFDGVNLKIPIITLFAQDWIRINCRNGALLDKFHLLLKYKMSMMPLKSISFLQPTIVICFHSYDNCSS